jgi:uncharacterized protein YqgV (UPF0045/DUF77 family)
MKKDYIKVKHELEQEIRRNRKQIKINIKGTNTFEEKTKEELSDLKQKVDSIDNQLQKVKDCQDTFKEAQDTKLLYRLSSLEQRVESDADNNLKLIRKLQREVQQNMLDVNRIMKEELESLRELKEEILNYHPVRDLQSSIIIEPEQNSAKSNNGFLYAKSVRQTDPVQGYKQWKSKEKDTSFNDISYLPSAMGYETKEKANNIHYSSLPKRRRRLKELYKELADLEIQEYSSN